MTALFELRKLFCRRVLTVLAALAAEVLLALSFGGFQHPYSPVVYRQYTERLSGEYSAQKREYVFARLDEINETVASHDRLEADYHHDLISLEEFTAHNKSCNLAVAERETLEYLAQKCERFEEQGGGRFFYDTDWSDFFSHRGYALTAAVLLLVLIPTAFCTEYSAGMYDVLRTAKHGKARLASIKLGICAAVMFLLSLALSAAEATVFFLRFGTDGMNEPMQSIMGFEAYGSISAVGALLRLSLLRACSFAVCAVAVCLISVLTRSFLYTVFLGAVVCISPALLTGGTAMCYVFSSAVQNGMYPAGLNVWLFCLICAVKCTAYGALTVRAYSRLGA